MNNSFRSRSRAAFRSMVHGFRDGARGVALTTIASAQAGREASQSLAQARFAQAAGQFGTSLRRALIQVPFDSALMIGGRLISAVQTVAGIEEPGRPLRLDEFTELKPIFGESIDFERVVIKQGQTGIGELSGERAFVHGNTIYMKRTPPYAWWHTLVHEMVHVWQHQTFGTSYLSEALWAQRKGAKAYEWKPDVDRGVAWTALGPEQQAAMVEAAYLSGYFRTGACRIGDQDYTLYMTEVHRVLRAGGPTNQAASTRSSTGSQPPTPAKEQP